jgi:hypothetical protein
MADAMTLSCFASSSSLMFNESLGYVEVDLLIVNSFPHRRPAFLQIFLNFEGSGLQFSFCVISGMGVGTSKLHSGNSLFHVARNYCRNFSSIITLA